MESERVTVSAAAGDYLIRVNIFNTAGNTNYELLLNGATQICPANLP